MVLRPIRTGVDARALDTSAAPARAGAPIRLFWGGFLLSMAIARCGGVEDPGAGQGSGSSSENSTGASSSVDEEDQTSGSDDDESSETGEQSEDGGACEVVECDPGRNDCGEGLKCTPWKCGEGCCMNSSRCVPITGKVQPGEKCDRDPALQQDDCEPTSLCMHDGGAGTEWSGKCQQMCAFEFDGPGNCEALGRPGEHCFSFERGAMPFCVETCDPVAGDCERDGMACYLMSNNFMCHWPSDPDGEQGEPGKEGEDCRSVTGCEPGLVCARDGQELTHDCDLDEEAQCVCSRICDVTADDPDEPCSVAFPSCEPIGELGPPGIGHVGLCK